MERNETVREAIERYAREYAYKASTTNTGTQFAEKIRLRFAGDRRMAALQRAFRDYCLTIRQTGDRQVDMTCVWDESGKRSLGDARFVY